MCGLCFWVFMRDDLKKVLNEIEILIVDVYLGCIVFLDWFDDFLRCNYFLFFCLWYVLYMGCIFDFSILMLVFDKNLDDNGFYVLCGIELEVIDNDCVLV